MGFTDNFNTHLADMLAQLGEPAVISLSAGGYISINGILDEQSIINSRNLMDIASVGIAFSCESILVGNVKLSDTITSGSSTFRILTREDANGVTVFTLERI